jgi:S-DNA-T family DNA segregation ATPase FtsK/SpoIIIE
MRLFAALNYQRRNEILGFLLIVLCLFVWLSLFTHQPEDDTWIRAGSDEEWVDGYHPHNLAGTVGALIAYGLYEWFGFSAYLLILLIGAFGLQRFLSARPMAPVLYSAGALAWIFVLGVIVDLPAAGRQDAWVEGGRTLSGWLGRICAGGTANLLGVVGGGLILGSALLGSILLILPWDKIKLARPAKKSARTARKAEPATSGKEKQPSILSRRFTALATAIAGKYRKWHQARTERKQAEAELVQQRTSVKRDQPTPVEPTPDIALPDWAAYEPDKPAGVPSPVEQAEAIVADRAARVDETAAPRPRRVMKMVRQPEGTDYQFPSLELLEEPPARRRRQDGQSNGAELLAKALATFDVGIDGPIETYPGPVITRYEFRPAPGVKVNQVVGLADDLALALSASRVRIVAPVPGKAAVGVEVPNRDPEVVPLSEILGSEDFANSDALLPLALGQTIDGQPFVADLASMPHLLIAGATGSGKSVCINVIITSLLFRHHPNDVRLLFVDPKRLELSVYAGIPHMERPVVTHPRGAERLLADAAREMDERYKTLAGMGVRNINDYNKKAPAGQKLPYIVIVVDELADLMMSQSAARIELLITRLAQMARAVGIHLILATQRPSVDVITGLIKANFSCRIAFQVASKIDSRTILDVNGADKLLGRGDMLYLSPGVAEPVRVHGAYISNSETSAIVEFLRAQNVSPEALPTFSGTVEVDAGGDSEGDESDPDGSSDKLFQEAAEVVIRHKQGSVSLLQRRLGIGYQRAARLIDKLEESGIVGAYDGSKAREVLWSMQDYEDRFAKSQD